MIDPEKLAQLPKISEQYQAILAELHRTLPPGETRDQLHALAGKMKETFAEAHTGLGELNANVTATVADAKAKLAAARVAIDAAKAKREEMQAAAKAKRQRKKEPKPLDAKLGERLRATLIAEYGEGAGA